MILQVGAMFPCQVLKVVTTTILLLYLAMNFGHFCFWLSSSFSQSSIAWFLAYIKIETQLHQRYNIIIMIVNIHSLPLQNVKTDWLLY